MLAEARGSAEISKRERFEAPTEPAGEIVPDPYTVVTLPTRPVWRRSGRGWTRYGRYKDASDQVDAERGYRNISASSPMGTGVGPDERGCQKRMAMPTV